MCCLVNCQVLNGFGKWKESDRRFEARSESEPPAYQRATFFTDLLTTLLTILADLIACKESHFSKGPSAAGDYDIGTISPIAEINDSRLG